MTTHRDPRLQSSWGHISPETGGGAPYGEMIDALRTLLDTLAGATPDETTSTALAADLSAWNDRLSLMQAPEVDRFFGRRIDLHGRGQVLTPPYTVDERAPGMIRGTVVFGSYYLGANNAVYGGALPLLLDEVMGAIANEGFENVARTAFMHVDYRAIVPIGKPLQVHAWIDRAEGRKRWIRGTLKDGDRLCTEAETLFLELKPGQP